jgi:agmatinase
MPRTLTRYGGDDLDAVAYRDAKIVVVPVPYDKTSTYGKGADKGPAALLDASGHMELYDIETQSEPYRRGIFTAPPVTESRSPERMTDAVEKEVAKHVAAGKLVVTLGGEHSVSPGAVRAHAKRHKGMAVLQLDAHTDLREEYEGSRHNHACAMARIRELCPIVQVGIRSMDKAEVKSLDRKSVFFAEQIQGKRNWQADVVTRLPKDVYITIDLDALDPSIMPSTGTPEPGGLQWYETLALLRMVAQKRTIVGFDVVELCPSPANRGPDFLAAKLVYKILGYIYELQGVRS